VAGRAVSKIELARFQQALIRMMHDEIGLHLLEQLNLSGFVYADERLYDAIEKMARSVKHEP
jgi:hypothetical protein